MVEVVATEVADFTAVVASMEVDFTVEEAVASTAVAFILAFTAAGSTPDSMADADLSAAEASDSVVADSAVVEATVVVAAVVMATAASRPASLAAFSARQSPVSSLRQSLLPRPRSFQRWFYPQLRWRPTADWPSTMAA